MAAWQTSGDVLVACNCDWGCPCNFQARPSRGHCEGGWVWRIEKGHALETSLDGLGIALFCKWPGAIHDGGGQAVCYIDDRANDDQRTALARLLRGELGGPWGIFIKTYALAEPVYRRFDLQIAGHATRAHIDGILELELQHIRNPVTQAELHPEAVLPEGLIVKRAGLAMSRVFRLRGRVEFDHSGQYAAFGRFDYA